VGTAGTIESRFLVESRAIRKLTAITGRNAPDVTRGVQLAGRLAGHRAEAYIYSEHGESAYAQSAAPPAMAPRGMEFSGGVATAPVPRT